MGNKPKLGLAEWLVLVGGIAFVLPFGFLVLLARGSGIPSVDWGFFFIGIGFWALGGLLKLRQTRFKHLKK